MKTSNQLPTARQMYDALCRRDAEFEGVFFVGVRTTGVFCRPTCPAKKPKFENVEFYHSTADALLDGFRPCKRCHPIECRGNPPSWLRALLEDVERDPSRRWTDQDVRNANCEPTRVRRWFKQNHGMTFHSYLRARRLGSAIRQLNVGTANASNAGFNNGYESASGFRDAFSKWFGESPASASRGLQPIVVKRLLTPLGPMIVAALEEKICLLEFANRKMLETQFKRVQQRFARAVIPGENELFLQVQKELDEYFDGLRQSFEFPMALVGTGFQESVWNELLKIPFGSTTSYESIAAAIGRPKACRAVGRANGDNCLAIVVPCHRVVRSDGSLSGYGGGVWRKRWLLEHEQTNRI